jgi:hypothetical protein
LRMGLGVGRGRIAQPVSGLAWEAVSGTVRFMLEIRAERQVRVWLIIKVRPALLSWHVVIEGILNIRSRDRLQCIRDVLRPSHNDGWLCDDSFFTLLRSFNAAPKLVFHFYHKWGIKPFNNGVNSGVNSQLCRLNGPRSLHIVLITHSDFMISNGMMVWIDG